MYTDMNYTVNDGYGSGAGSTLPDPFISTSKKIKDKKWQKETVEYYIQRSYNNCNTRRKSFNEMRHNRNVFNSVMNYNILKEGLDPLGVIEDSENVDFPYQFYNIIEQPILTLLGEELRRPYDVKAFAINPEAINEKDKIFFTQLRQYIEGLGQRQDLPEDILREDLERMERWKKEDLQSAHEKMVNQILQAFLHDPNINFKDKSNKAFQDQQIIAEAVMRVGREGKDPQLYNVDSENFFVYGLGDSCHIEDGSAWIEWCWYSKERILQEFSEELVEKDVKDIYSHRYSSPAIVLPTPLATSDEVTRNDLPNVSQYIPVDSDLTYMDNTFSNSRFVDQYGNIRVIRVQWITPKKVGYLTTFDQETGEPIYTFVDETYKPDASLGETIKWIYVEELWEGIKIGDEKYIRVQPCDIQLRSMSNPAKVRPLYVGVIRAYNGNMARSRLDMALQLQNDYNIWSNKLRDLWTKNLGKLAIIDASKIPSTMKTEEWFVWLRRFGLVFENPFEEHKKRPELIAGNMQQGHKMIDLSLATEINQAIQYLQYIQQEVNRIMAVPDPRQGNMTGNEGLGVSQQAIISSNSQTEIDFSTHDYLRARLLEVLVEYTKFLWKDEKGKRQYLLDDLSNYILDVDGSLLMEAEYGVRITNTGKAVEMNTILKSLIHPAMQNGTTTLVDAAKALLADSPSNMLKMLESSEDKRIKQQQEAERIQQETQQQALQMQAQMEEQKHAREMEKLSFTRETELLKLQLQLQSKAISEDAKYAFEGSRDDNKDGVEDQIELDKQRLANEVKDREISSKEKIERMKLDAERDMLREQLKAQKEIARMKGVKSN
jgi:hypothetical protein